MTTYNCANHIGQAVKSILDQTYGNFELLIIDDGSTDNTEEIIKQFKDPRISYVKNNHLGIGAAANVGLKLAKYNWITRFDSDDICHPELLEIQIKYLENQYVIVSSYCAYFKKDKIIYVTESGNSSEKVKEQLKLHSVVPHSGCIYNKQFILNELCGYNENLSAFIDYDLWLRALEKANFIIVPKVLVFARIRNVSISNSALYKNDKVFYNLQNLYLSNDLIGVNDFILKGWREFFYGSPPLVRMYWRNVNIKAWNYRMVLAFFVSLLPNRIIYLLKKQRLRLKLKYIFNRFTKYRYLGKEFNQILNS